MPMYNLIQYSDIYLKTLRSLWQYYEDGLALENNKMLLILLLIKIIVFRSRLNKK